MKRLLFRIVQRLRDPGQPLSRNRHYASFEAAEGRRALEIHRHVRSLEADLIAQRDPARIRVVRCEDGGRVRVELPLNAPRASRTAYLTAEELELLLATPEAGPRLRQARWEPAAPEGPQPDGP